MKPSVKLAAFPFVRETQRLDTPAVGGPLKRAFDVVSAALGLFMLSPLFIMMIILIKMSDGGPVFYRHRRIGRGGRPFYCLKFRTMKTNGDAILESYLRENPQAQAEWISTRKLQSDPRVTDVGSVIRKLSLDELPQLLNILRGEMSIVGPRPIIGEELELYGPAAAYYMRSRPGLTGIWQISGRNDVPYDKRVAYDQGYVENWSFRGDVAIILKTIPVVCAARGSY